MTAEFPSDTAKHEPQVWPSTPKKRLLGDETYLVLKDALTSNRILPGQRLVIDSLARDLNVSITPIRHALSRLHSEGLVTQEPYKGFVASPLLDRATVAEIYDARRILETELIARAAKSITPEDLAFLKIASENEPLTSFTSEENGPDLLSQNYDEALHRRIAMAGGNRTVVSILDSLTDRMRAYRAFESLHEISNNLFIPSTEAISQTMVEHAGIVSALRAGDSVAAQKAMSEHLAAAAARTAAAVGGA
jgi:DNA-binding GntR family transcriptional regulator